CGAQKGPHHGALRGSCISELSLDEAAGRNGSPDRRRPIDLERTSLTTREARAAGDDDSTGGAGDVEQGETYGGGDASFAGRRRDADARIVRCPAQRDRRADES